MTATPEIVMPSQMRNQRRMVRASSVAGSRKGDMGGVESGELDGAGMPRLRGEKASGD